MTTPRHQDLSDALRQLLKAIPVGSVTRGETSSKRLVADIRKAIERLRDFSQRIDRVHQPETVFDPYRPEVLGRFTAETLLDQERRPLERVPDFYGSGVYAIYYLGDFNAYRPISGKDWPIYVGKADPSEPHAGTPEEQGVKLSKRLGEHAKSIASASNLRIEDFECRLLVVKSGLQKAAEDFLIHRFSPVWNNESRICKGFGKHGDSASTRKNRRSEWDTIHPGRRWASGSDNPPNAKTADQIILEILSHLSQQQACSGAS